MQKLEQAVLIFGYRELNKVADFMAKKRSTLQLNEEIFFQQVDEGFRHLIVKDILSNYNRCISNPCTDLIMLK